MDFKTLRKNARSVPPEKKLPSGKRLTAIVTLKEEGDAPDKLQVRTVIAAKVVTGEFLSDDFAELKADPKIENISLSEVIPLEKTPP